MVTLKSIKEQNWNTNWQRKNYHYMEPNVYMLITFPCGTLTWEIFCKGNIIFRAVIYGSRKGKIQHKMLILGQQL
jgi:hypothetical protein